MGELKKTPNKAMRDSKSKYDICIYMYFTAEQSAFQNGQKQW